MRPVSFKTPVKTTPIVPSGPTPFVIYAIWHIGVIPGEFGPQDQVIIGLELPNLPPLEYKEDNGTVTKKPRAIVQFFKNTMSKKGKLRGLLESWRGKAFTDQEANEFSLASILGKCGQVNVVHTQKRDGSMKAEIGALFKGPPVVGTIKQELFSVLSLENAAELKTCGIPDWVQKQVERSEDYMELLQNGGRVAKSDPSTSQPDGPPDNPTDDEVPF